MASTGVAVRHVAASRAVSVDRSLFGAGAVALVPVALVLIATTNGLGMSYDSVVYASTRRELLETGEWSFSSLWPIGYPVLLAMVGTGVGAVALACVALWANLMVSYRLAMEVTGSTRAALAVLAWLSASLATVSVFSMMWSDGLFCLAVNVMLLALVKVHRAQRLTPGWATALVAAVCAGGVLRFAALSLLPAVGLTLLIALRPMRWRGLLYATGVTAACSAGLLFSAARNLLVGAEPMGERLPSGFTVADVAQQIPTAASQYVLNTGTVESSPLGALVVAGLLGLVVVWLRRLGPAELRRHPVMPLLVLSAAYLSFLVASEMLTYIDGLDFRLLAPAQTSVAVVMVTAGRSVIGRGLARWLAITGVVALLAFMVAASSAWSVSARQDGFGQQRLAMRYVGLREAVAQTIPPGAVIVADFPSILVLITGRDEVVGFPDAGPHPPRTGYLPYAVRQAVRPGDYVVVMADHDEVPPSWNRLYRRDRSAVYRAR